MRPGGGIGRRTGLKIPRWRQRAGSIPAPGTNFYELLLMLKVITLCNNFVTFYLINNMRYVNLSRLRQVSQFF